MTLGSLQSVKNNIKVAKIQCKAINIYNHITRLRPKVIPTIRSTAHALATHRETGNIAQSRGAHKYILHPHMKHITVIHMKGVSDCKQDVISMLIK